MNKSMFYHFGRFIYPARWLIVILFSLFFIICIPLLPRVTAQFTDTGLTDPHSQSDRADQYLHHHLNYFSNRYIVMYQSKLSFAHDKTFSEEIRYSLSGLNRLPFTYKIIYPDENKKQVSKDQHSAYAIVLLKSNQKLSNKLLKKFKSSVKKPHHLTMLLGGEPIFQSDIQNQTQLDLIKAELIATPIAIITLLFVFGSVMAAIIPIILDAVCTVFILALLYFVGHKISLSLFTINIALLLGVCLSLDYTLFIIGRFREELAGGRPIVEALAITQATAGKAIFFSGLAVLVSLSALFFFPVNILLSVGVGGVTAVAFAVLVSIVLLPAILAILQKKINYLPIKIFTRKNNQGKGYWLWSVGKVIKHSWVFFFIIMMILLLLSYPILGIKFGLSDFRILPKSLESRQVFDILKNEFNENELSPIIVMVKTPQEGILTTNNIRYLYSFANHLKANLSIDYINSIVTTEPRLNLLQYQQLYVTFKQYQNDSIKKLLMLTTQDHFTVMTVISDYPNLSYQSKQIVEFIRSTTLRGGLKVAVTGVTANTMDVMSRICTIFPYALLWVLVLTGSILLILLRSLFLPFKAIMMNILSLTASYGVLVFIFQQGYFSSLLGFDPQGMIDITLLVIIFCALFGFSMDYEVFLLSRIKEFYEQTHDTNKSICYGIAFSSKIITSAAVVVILICFAFMSADIVMVKAFGLGIAVAIFVDAFLIRTILVPATMAIFQKWCWYLPRWLDRLLPTLL